MVNHEKSLDNMHISVYIAITYLVNRNYYIKGLDV